MQLATTCPQCQSPVRVDALQHDADEAARQIECASCQWSRVVSADEISDNFPAKCLMCGCHDLWRQKDFPPVVGLTIVGVGMLLSTIAFYNYYPIVALGILMVFALGDLLLYTLMNDVLVCYRCGTQHRDVTIPADFLGFDLEVAERYRQEAKRLEDATQGRS